ncbi:SMP-30/gluconolactonase/LRE family protein [Salipaludibacillus aurantiacus]|uniref:Sugar lactone lactonase YvrE n=1 Tax=Salipaludibacillus aurantiacus TaxID=1601833 RepID=A0A1H9V0P1_9BACI|nr:SMP-30/gluconolactonase/LRE family protein [Salipaludibacillus aurantiacus]SES14833.1 Sugar lactone lactonase YvrE [Salipaludibacillus aurantiacus]
MFEPELVLDSKAALAEGPSWNAKSQKLLWVDINGHTVNAFDPETGGNESLDVGEKVGAVVPRENGGLVLAMESGFYTYSKETKELTPVEDPEAHLKGTRFNDGKCDPQGRFWAGTMVMEGEPGEANLYRLDHDLKVNLMISDVTVSNGLAWNPEKSKMYYIDTKSKKIRSYEFDGETGSIDEERTIITIPEDMGSPDGMTIDEEGMLWIAFFHGGKVVRFNPDNGDSLSEVLMPASNVTSCAFGGENLDELYITTAREGLTEEELDRQPHAGGIFRIKPGVKGAPSYTFQG